MWTCEMKFWLATWTWIEYVCKCVWKFWLDRKLGQKEIYSDLDRIQNSENSFNLSLLVTKCGFFSMTIRPSIRAINGNLLTYQSPERHKYLVFQDLLSFLLYHDTVRWYDNIYHISTQCILYKI
jgi:hypothetical protein